MKRKKVRNNFFEFRSPNSLYVMGFFAADGSLSINKRGGYYFSIQSKDRQIISDIKKVMASEHKISKRNDVRTGGCFYRIQIGSKSIYNSLIKNGFGNKKTQHLPSITLNKNDFPHFLRGYFDGDGNIWHGTIHKDRKTHHKNTLLAFTCASYDFLYYLKTNLHQMIHTHGSLFRGNRNFSRLQYSSGDALKIYDFMYNASIPFLYLKRKKRNFDRVVNNMQR